ncbi:MAG TPA: hypothetical protein VF050_00405 [Moraxellaceae bacterium]
MNRRGKEYCGWGTLLADAGKYWIGLSKADVLMAQQSEADLLCLLRKKYGLSDGEAMQQISDYLKDALASGPEALSLETRFRRSPYRSQ